MVDLQGIIVALGNFKDKALRVVPKFKVDKYEYGAAGVEFTCSKGVGIGLGLGVVDLWFGWPRREENLHFSGCVHRPLLTVDEISE